MDLLDRLLGHDEWTTSELLRRCQELSSDQMHQPFDIGWCTVHRTLVHMVSNVRTWTDLMAGQDASESGEGWWDYDLAALTRAHEESWRDFAAIAHRVQDQQLWNENFVDTLDSPPTSKTLGGGVLHVITHNMHHRSEVLHILARLGLEDLPEGDLLGWEQNVAANKEVIH